MDISEKLILQEESMIKGFTFLENLKDEEAIEVILSILKKQNGTIAYHESLASIATTKEDFLLHVQEMQRVSQEVKIVFKKYGFNSYSISVMEAIQHQQGLLGKLNPKAVELGLMEIN